MKNLTEQSREPTNSTHIIMPSLGIKFKPDHIGGSRMLSLLSKPCFPQSSSLFREIASDHLSLRVRVTLVGEEVYRTS